MQTASPQLSENYQQSPTATSSPQPLTPSLALPHKQWTEQDTPAIAAQPSRPAVPAATSPGVTPATSTITTVATTATAPSPCGPDTPIVPRAPWATTPACAAASCSAPPNAPGDYVRPPCRAHRTSTAPLRGWTRCPAGAKCTRCRCRTGPIWTGRCGGGARRRRRRGRARAGRSSCMRRSMKTMRRGSGSGFWGPSCMGLCWR